MKLPLVRYRLTDEDRLRDVILTKKLNAVILVKRNFLNEITKINTQQEKRVFCSCKN